MADERIIVEFTTQGLPQTQQDIDNLQDSALGSFSELNSQLELFQAAMAGLQGVAGALYGALIDSNERLNAELLKSQVALASTLEIYKGSTQVTDITEKITSSQGALRDALKVIEKDTTELVGVTTDQVNGIFQILLQNASSFIGQSKEFSNPIEAATASTKGWAAALGTLGLPLEQANQEIRSILQGDVNNPDSVIAKTLAISKEQYNQWVANGELIDRINEKLAVYVEGNKLASQSVAAITSNIQSYFEDVARMAGEPLLAPIVAALSDVYELLNQNRELVEELAGENVADLVSLFETLREAAAKIGVALNISPEGFLKEGSELIGNLIAAAEGLINLGASIISIFGPALSQALGNTFSAISFGLEGIAKLANLLAVAGDALAGFMKIANLGGGLDLGKVFDNAQASVAMLTGEYRDAIEATATYRDITATLTAQAEKIATSGNASSAMVKGQIEQLEEQKESLKGLKTYREEDKASVEAQIEAVDKSIKTLEGLKTAQDELTFKAPELQKLGTMMELLGKNADAALATINRDGGGKKEVFEEAVKSLTELTQKQVEYGQITAEEGITRLGAVVANTKVELETREAALEAMKKLESDFTKFKVAQLDLEAEAVERKVKQGSLSEIQGAQATAEIAKKQSDLQIESLNEQIKRAESLGQSTTELALERDKLISKQADNELATIEKVAEIREQEQEEAYQKAISAAQESETQRLLALEKALAAKKISEEEYNEQTLAATKERLDQELAAEQANLAQLQALLGQAGTADQREEIEKKIADSKKKSTEIQLQAAKAEAAAIKAANEERLKSVQDSYEKSVDSAELAESQVTLNLKQQLANRQISQKEYDEQVGGATKARLQAELEATNEQVTKLAAIAASQGDNKDATEALSEAKKKQIEITQKLLDLQIQGQKEALEASKEAIEETYKNSINKAQEAESANTIALKQGLLDRTLTQEQYDNRILESRRTRLQAELQAEQENIAKLSSLKVTGVDERKEIEDKITEAKKRSQKATEELLDIELNARDKIVDAYKTQLAEKLKASEVGFAEQEARIRQTEKNEEQAQIKIAKLNVDRIRAQLQAEEEAAAKLSSLGDTKGAEDKKLEIRKIAISLIDAEIAAEKALQDVVKSQMDERKKNLDLEFSEREVKIKQNVENEAKAQSEIANLNIERIKAQMAEEEKAVATLAAMGDEKGAAAKKAELRKLAISLIEAEISAEKALQNVLKNELELLKKRLDLKKGAQEIDLLEEELKLAEAVKNGTLTKEQAEKAKLEITRSRVAAELELLKGLEGKGDESENQKNIQDQLKAKIQLAEIDTKIADASKEQLGRTKEQKKEEKDVNDVLKEQIDKIKRANDIKLAGIESQRLALSQIAALTELEAQSVQRVVQLRQAQGDLIGTQLSSLESGLNNELSLVNAALSSRTKLSEIEKQLATDTKLTSEQKVVLEKEAVALRAQLGALGAEGGKTELQLIEQRMAAEQRQIQVKREQLALSQEMAAIELANQRAAIELDKVRAEFKARELELEAKKLDIQASQLEAQAGLTKDDQESEALRRQAANLKEQSANTRELSQAQKESAQEEAALRERLLENQAKIGELQAKAQEETLDTQQKLLNSQQAYERSLKGLEPKINTKSVDEFSAKIKNIREEIKKVATVNLPALKLTPGNLNVSVKDDRSASSLKAIQRSSKDQANSLSSVKSSVAPLGNKLDAINKAVKNLQLKGGGGGSAEVKNQVTVNVTGNAPKPTVTVQSLIENRKKECGCK